MSKLGYDEIVKLVAANNQSGQADTVIIALIYKESRFDPDAKAAASTATGLMQITRTAVTEVNRVKHTAYAHAAMTIPAFNIVSDRAISSSGSTVSAAISQPVLMASALASAIRQAFCGQQLDCRERAIRCRFCLRRSASHDRAVIRCRARRRRTAQRARGAAPR